MADGTGVSVREKELTVHSDGNTVTLPWTLENYFKVTRKFPSTTHLQFSVKINKMLLMVGTYVTQPDKRGHLS